MLAAFLCLCLFIVAAAVLAFAIMAEGLSEERDL